MKQHEVRQLLTAAHEAWGAGQRVALATVVHVIGSAYRREGAKMLISESGSLTCMISGGCLESEVAVVAKEVLDSGIPRRTLYDLEEDVVWGLGLGCGGAVEILIEPLEQNTVLSDWLELQEGGETAFMATVLSGGEGRLLGVAGDLNGCLSPPDLQAQVVAKAAELLEQPTPRAARHLFETPAGEAEVFIDVASPPLELVLFGAGHDARPLAADAQRLGFNVTIIDPRPAFANAEGFPDACIILTHPQGFAESVQLSSRSYAVIMNHHLERDRESLHYALSTNVPYVGVLGPRSRYQKLLDALAEEGRPLTESMKARVRSPLGLAIGAEGPEEVALSILTEIMAFSRGFEGGFLDGWSGRIHRSRQA